MTGPSTFLHKAAVHVAVSMVLGFLAALSFGQTTADSEQKLKELSAQAQSAQQRGDYASATQAYKTLAELRPDIPEVWANLGLMYQFMGNYSQADHDFQIALKKNPRLYVPNLFLGINRLRAHQAHAALPYLKSAVSLNSQDEQAALGLARAYAEIHDDDDASRWFERALQINPQDSDAWYGLGITYLSVQDAAVIQLKKLGPDNIYARVLVADAFLEQGRTNEAVKIYEKFQAQNRPPCLKSQLGLAYAQTGAIDKAKLTLEQEGTENSGCLLADIGLARIALSNGDIAEMLRQLHRVDDRERQFLLSNLDHLWKGQDPEIVKNAVGALQQQPWVQDPISSIVIQAVNSQSPTDLARRDATAKTQDPANTISPKAGAKELWGEGRYTACAAKLHEIKLQTPMLTGLLEQCSFFAAKYQLTLETSRHALLGNPYDSEALYWEAKSAEQLSADAFSQMSAVAPNSPKVHLLMAQLHRAREEYPIAEEEYIQVLRARASAEEQTAAHLGLAHIYVQDSADDKALEQLQAVLTADASNADGHGLVGELLVQRHQFKNAIPHLKLALRGASDEFLPELHSLLAKCDATKGDYAEAVRELEPALTADTMGAFHYQLYQLYQKIGDQRSARAALQKSEELRQQKARAEQQHTMLTSP